MADNNFKSNGESALLDLRTRNLLEKLTADKSLNLNVLYLRNKDIKALSLYQKLQEVISLSLRNNLFNHQGLGDLATSPFVINIESLNLMDNSIGDKGVFLLS